MLMIFLLLILIVIISQYKLFKKANEPGWAAFIPIYNMIVWLRIINKPWWWILLMFIPYAGFIWQIWATNLLVKKFGRDEGFTIGVIFLPFIFYPILAFGSSKFLDVKKNSIKDFHEGFDASAKSKKSKGFDTSSEQLLNESQNNNGSSNIDFFSPTKASSRENDLKLELEKELDKFENKMLSEKFNVDLSDDEIDYWYKIICDRVRMCASNLKEMSDEDILLENIFGHCDEYGKKHINEDFEFKRNHTTMRILSYGFIFRCVQKISEKISNDNSGISSEFEKEIRLKLIHSKASLYGTIKFALISNIKKDEIKKMFPEFEDDPKLIEGKNSLEEMLMKGFEMDDDNPNKKRLEGIYDGQKRVPIYELSEKQRINIPLWFKGPFYKRGSEVTSKATGNSFKLNALEKSIFVEIQYNTAMITILSEEGVVSRANFNNPFLEYMVEVIDKGTEWFESNNIKAFEALFDTK